MLNGELMLNSEIKQVQDAVAAELYQNIARQLEQGDWYIERIGQRRDCELQTGSESGVGDNHSNHFQLHVSSSDDQEGSGYTDVVVVRVDFLRRQT